MIREILNGEFMNYKDVYKEFPGLPKRQIREQKRAEGIQTLTVTNKDGEALFLWFDPQAIWEKYSE